MDVHHHDPVDRVHALIEMCPLCDQEIPNDRLAGVKARHAEHEREMQSRVARAAKDEQERLTRLYTADKADALAKLQSEMAARETAARTAERKATLAEADARIVASAKATATAQDEAVELKKKIEASAVDAAAKIKSACEEASRQAQAALEPQLVAAAAAKALAETEKAAALAAKSTAQGEAEKLKKRLEASESEVTAKINSAREEAAQQVQATLKPQLDATAAVTAADAEKVAALTAKLTAEAAVAALTESQDKLVAERTQEARTALEKAHQQALDNSAARNFEDNQKLRAQVADLARQLETKNANELGEGAEVNLFDALKNAFPSDDIERIAKGAPGADIRHKVLHNGKVCGLILYDSKNHKAWRNEFVTKLRDDQLHAEADHAVLSTIAFPQGTSQLHMQGGVVLVNPARAVMVAALLRAHILQSHTLRLSNEDREEKAEELYSFITSDRFSGQLAKIHSSVDALLKLEIAEQTAHRRTWTTRGSLLTAVGKAEADLRVSIQAVVGTAEGLDAALDEVHRVDDASTAS